MEDNSVVGFTWGYPLLSSGKQTMIDGVISLGYDPSSLFYGAETGIGPSERGRGIATMLVQKRIFRQSEPLVCFRTKNPAMVAIYQKLVGKPLDVFSQEEAYPGGVGYVLGASNEGGGLYES